MTTSKSARHGFDIVLEWCGPDFDQERRFVALERERLAKVLVQRRSLSLAKRLWSVSVSRTDSELTRYERDLRRYATELSRLENDIERGLLMFKALLINIGSEGDENITASLVVTDGTFKPGRQDLQRPETPEGLRPRDKHAAAVSMPIFSGFRRSGMTLTSGAMGAHLSKLDQGDEAYILNQIVFLSSTGQTEVRYRIESRHLKTAQTGTIELNDEYKLLPGEDSNGHRGRDDTPN